MEYGIQPHSDIYILLTLPLCHAVLLDVSTD